jgi:hypothetical protein
MLLNSLFFIIYIVGMKMAKVVFFTNFVVVVVLSQLKHFRQGLDPSEPEPHHMTAPAPL